MGAPALQEHTERSVEFAVLGSVRALVDGREINLGRPRQRRLLAALLVRAGETVRTDSLIENVWDDPSRPAAFADQPWCEPETARLVELRLLARERRAETLLELGEHGRIVADLERLVSEEPRALCGSDLGHDDTSTFRSW